MIHLFLTFIIGSTILTIIAWAINPAHVEIEHKKYKSNSHKLHESKLKVNSEYIQSILQDK